MDTDKIKLAIMKFIQKYKYAVLIFVLGIVLMMIPFGEQTESTEEIHINESSASVEERLKMVLSQIYGVGAVDVMLKELTGEEYIYQTDEDRVLSGDSSSVRGKTITVTDGQRNDVGLIRQIKPPTYQGAIVICQGGDDPKVRLAVAEAVSKITGLGTDQIAVLKMK